MSQAFSLVLHTQREQKIAQCRVFSSLCVSYDILNMYSRCGTVCSCCATIQLYSSKRNVPFSRKCAPLMWSILRKLSHNVSRDRASSSGHDSEDENLRTSVTRFSLRVVTERFVIRAVKRENIYTLDRAKWKTYHTPNDRLRGHYDYLVIID